MKPAPRTDQANELFREHQSYIELRCRAVARQLAAHVRCSDISDHRQELLLAVWRGLAHYDPLRGAGVETFVTVLLKTTAAKILRDSRTIKSQIISRAFSFDALEAASHDRD